MGGDSSSLKSSRQDEEGHKKGVGGGEGRRIPCCSLVVQHFHFIWCSRCECTEQRSCCCYAQKQWQHLVAHPFSFVLSKSQKCLETRRGLPTFRSHCLAHLDKARRITQQHQKQQRQQQRQKSSLLDNQLKIAACNYSQAQQLPQPFTTPSLLQHLPSPMLVSAAAGEFILFFMPLAIYSACVYSSFPHFPPLPLFLLHFISLIFLLLAFRTYC